MFIFGDFLITMIIHKVAYTRTSHVSNFSRKRTCAWQLKTIAS
ncbi:hypothetical protein M758_12G095900 [Ceratodon purpureus]|uniref:Uncharacterized protein n=1 Tax=Ceratodon purpureus TaxID=3225 RepID=A0A8T0G6G7_CERPU|nr:hypothetical protein KC19_12G092500 [Ceratodon purpureus]KAG0598717.1 hypothetical protein M758_12G095900 [Ceratodon purpureus]